MKYISYQTADGDTKNINVDSLTDDQIIIELGCLQLVGESGAEQPLTAIILHRDGDDYVG